LVLVDGAAIRKKIKKDYEKALGDLERSRQQLDQFNQSDLPEFTRWLNAHFGALLTELRELGQKVAADQELIFQVESECFFSGGSPIRAYQRVMKFRENPEPPPPPREERQSEGNGEPFEGAPESEDFGDEEDSLRDFFNDVFGDFGPGPREDARGGGVFSGPLPAKSEPAHTTARLKELYRALVRRLHPDAQQQMTAQKTEWWHQAQAAYEGGDTGQLEIILTLCEIEDSGTTAHTSASLLQRITAQLKTSLREIKRQISERRHDPAWGFSGRTDREALAARMGEGMKRDIARMREVWRETQEVIAGWKAAAENLKPPRRRKRRDPGLEFPF
jgi:hypothetical protein